MANPDEAEDPQHTERMLDWHAVVSSFRVTSARERLELAFGDHDGGVRVAEEFRLNAGRHVQHVGPAGRAEVLLPGFEIASGIVFEVRVIPAQSVFANLIGSRVKVGNNNAGIVAALPPDDIGAG